MPAFFCRQQIGPLLYRESALPPGARGQYASPMRTCAFLTTADLTGFVTDDDLAIPALAERGWNVEPVPWRSDAEWDRFDAVVVRTTWDYQAAPAHFLQVLERIAASRARLANDLDVMRWNMDKRYLRDLEDAGVAIPRSVWLPKLTDDDVPRLFAELGADEIIIKPVVSANADHTYRVRREERGCRPDEIVDVFEERACIVQPFLPRVLDEGEYSVIFFLGEYSHALLKTPKHGDFRVQEEHGGRITRVHATDALLDAARRALAPVAPVPLYARADFVRDDGAFLLMELELIEPALYFRMDESAPARFADALVAWMAEVSI